VGKSGVDRLTEKAIWYVTDDGALLVTVVDGESGWAFQSEDEPGQWYCWDFREMRVIPAHYIIWTPGQRPASSPRSVSWFVQASWSEIDRQPDYEDLKGKTASFVVSNPAEFRFIRLTQTGKNYHDTDVLSLCAVEFTGTLYE
jgi:hypothetical protein